MSMSRLMVTRREESLEEQNSLEPQLELVRQRTKELQKQASHLLFVTPSAGSYCYYLIYTFIAVGNY